MLVGLVLLALEIFVVPGFSIPGIAGIGCLIYSSIKAWRDYGPWAGLAIIVVSFVAFVIAAVTFPKTRAAKRMTQTRNLKDDIGVDTSLAALVGKTGIAQTILRPSGTALIDDTPVSVVTDGEFIDPNTPIRVLEVEGNRVVVEAA